MRVRIKICGLARVEDARAAAELGVDFLGLVLADSPRGVVARKISAWVHELRTEFPKPAWVGVFVRPSSDDLARAVETLPLDYLQIHGMPAAWRPDTLPRPWIRVLNPRSAREYLGTDGNETDRNAAEAYATLIDTPRPDGYGGTGEVFDWHEVGRFPPQRRIFLAGGLEAENVAAAIRIVRPWAVDASSRLEMVPGKKDPIQVRAFVEAVRRTSQHLEGESS